MVVAQSKVCQAEERLRESVNRPAVQDELIKDSQMWNQLCASMDAIGDTDMAVASYQRLKSVDDFGMLYLNAYGLLQVLFVQQDAVQHAAQAVGFNYAFSQELRDIREIRNCAVGHPTKRDRPRVESFGIVRISLTQHGFTLYSFDWKNGTPWRDVSIPALIERQTKEVCDALARIVEHLNNRFGCI